MRKIAAIILSLFALDAIAIERVARWASDVKREAQAVQGIYAPVPMYLAQIHQESGGRENITASDLGRGLAQFMDATASWVSEAYPELGAPDPYNPKWAIRALIRLDMHNHKRVRGVDSCQKWGAALKAYNAGLGYVQKAQAASNNPEQWFGFTEYVKTRQSAKNMEYSRLYPRWILYKHQPQYSIYGSTVCIN